MSRIYGTNWRLHKSDLTTVVDEHGNTVANCGGMRIGNRHKTPEMDVRGEQEANARQIAALPDLLAVCEALASVPNVMVDEQQACHAITSNWFALKAAIAKARSTP